MNKKSDLELQSLLKEVTANDGNQSNTDIKASDQSLNLSDNTLRDNSMRQNRLSLRLNTYTIRFGLIALIVCIVFIVSFLLFNDTLMSVF